MGEYFFNVLVSVDQLINALTAGNPDETISSRTWRERPNSNMRKVIDFLFSWHEKDHCRKSYERELARQRAFQ
jgi:hypothetical protein